MSEPQSYPSPNAAQMAAGAAGLYAHPNGNMSPAEASSAVDPHLSLHSGQTLEQELSAQLRGAAEAPMPAQHQQPQHGLPMAHVGQVHTPVQQPSTPQQMAQNAMNMAQDPHYSQQDSNQRKRSKVSRACDECRRKKIRCDATSENGPEACTSCKRTGARCQFSRQPMKRGPSKGYIKELADRLTRLEYEQQQQVGHSPQSGQQHSQVPELQSYLQSMGDQGMAGLADFSATSPAPHYGSERKRTHSMSEGPGDQFRTSLSQPPNGVQQSWDRREPFGTGYEHDAAGTFFEFSQNADVAVNEYYRVIQDTYPVLPFDLRNLKGRLANCDAKLRDAFTAAIDCAVRAWPSTSLAMEPNHQDRCYKAYQMLTSLVGTTVKPAGIILVQSFLLLTIEADVHGPRRSQPLSYPDSQPLKDMCLAQATRVATSLRFDALIFRQRGQEISPDNDEALGRRLFWVLFIFDQLHAISTATTPSLSAERSHLTGDDETLFGPVTFALARLCKAMGGLPDYYRTLAEFPPTNNDVLALYDPNNAIMKMTKTAFLSSLERFSETLPSDPHPLILLAYFHVHLLIVRYTPGSEPGEILHDATAIVTHLQRHQALITTPHHHFAALAALTLGELAEKDETREESLRLLGELEGVLNRNKVEGDLGWDASVREYAGKKRSSINESNGGASSTMLEHLAEAAVGERRDSGSKASPSENRPGSSGGGADPPKDDISNAAAAAAAAVAAAASLNQSLHFNPANLVRDGYLNILAQVLNQQQPQQH
ncbi:Glucose-responsive transcription factor [Diplodia intermedia]|uniref:Glucose-responsive transcription factor n=1 Tax=Diplodia intermedia TaxID=856260 RepID=A0ABR3U288_9PEZI